MLLALLSLPRPVRPRDAAVGEWCDDSSAVRETREPLDSLSRDGARSVAGADERDSKPLRCSSVSRSCVTTMSPPLRAVCCSSSVANGAFEPAVDIRREVISPLPLVAGLVLRLGVRPRDMLARTAASIPGRLLGRL